MLDPIEARFNIDLPENLVGVARLEVRRRANSVQRPPRLGRERTEVINLAASAVVGMAVVPRGDHRLAPLLEVFHEATDALGLPRYTDGGLVPGALVVRNSDRGRVW